MQSVLIIIAILLTTIVSSMGTSLAFMPKPPFMTVSEYVQVHPEQAALQAAFAQQVHDESIKTEQNIRPVKVTFIYPGKQVSGYWRKSVISFKKRMAEIGITPIIEEYFSEPSEDAGVQIRHLQEALSKDPDYLVFSLDVFTHKAQVEKLLKKSHPKIILQNITTPLRDWEGRQPFMYIGFDHTIGTRMIADFFIKKTKGVGSYGLLYFPPGYVNTMRGDTFHRYIEIASQLRMAGSAQTNAQIDPVAKETSRLLRMYNLDFLYACSTDIALGAIKAIKEQNKLGKVMVNGWGGGTSELEAILAGEMDVTVMRMNDDNGVAMAEAIRMDVTGNGHKVPQIYSGEMVLVEKGISPAELNKLVDRAFRYSGR